MASDSMPWVADPVPVDIKADDEVTDLLSEELGTIEGLDETSVSNGVMDKEMLRRIKRKERNKLNRKRKKALQRNLSQVTASDLQQSVASLATSIGDSSSTFINDPFKFSDQQAALDQTMDSINDPLVNVTANGLVDSVGSVSAVMSKLTRPTSEVALCILDSDNFNGRLSGSDLVYINDYLEQCLYNDLTLTAKIKIANTYISTERRIWVICHSQFTSTWVIRKIAKMSPVNNRKLVAHTLTELEAMTMVTILVPKECSQVGDFSDLMRYLILQNPSLGKGTALQEVQKSTIKRISGDASQEDEDNLDDLNDPKTSDCTFTEGESNGAVEPVQGEEAAATTTPQMTVTKPADLSAISIERPELSRHSRNRSFSLYADDTWLNELRQLDYRPYLGVRRLLCALGPRTVQRAGPAALHKKRKRGGGKKNWVKGGARTDDTTTTTATTTIATAVASDATSAIPMEYQALSH